MNKFNVIEILRLGVNGLGFLLAFLAYRLLAKEQSKKEPHEKNIKAIKQFMAFSIILCLIALIPNFINLNKSDYPNPSSGENTIYEFTWTNVTGEYQLPDIDTAIDMTHVKEISVEGRLLTEKNENNKNIKLEVQTSTYEEDIPIYYHGQGLRDDGSVNFALTPKPGFMRLRLHVNGSNKVNFKALVNVTF